MFFIERLRRSTVKMLLHLFALISVHLRTFYFFISPGSYLPGYHTIKKVTA
jgi:hypothetical protein